MKCLLLIALAALAACKDETLTGYGAAGQTWVLHSIDGAPFTQRATIAFPEEGRITGDAPCNSYFARQTLPYPWFKAEGIGATKRACPALAAEQAYFDALARMTLAEVAGATLILSTEAGDEMVFRAD